MTTAVNALAGKFTRESGQELDITLGTVGALQAKQKAMPQTTGGEVAARVAEGQADLGLTLIAEIVPIAGAICPN